MIAQVQTNQTKLADGIGALYREQDVKRVIGRSKARFIDQRRRNAVVVREEKIPIRLMVLVAGKKWIGDCGVDVLPTPADVDLLLSAQVVIDPDIVSVGVPWRGGLPPVIGVGIDT